MEADKVCSGVMYTEVVMSRIPYLELTTLAKVV